MGLPVPDGEAAPVVPDIALERSAAFSLFALWCDLEEAYSTFSTIFKNTGLYITAPYVPVYPLKYLWEKFTSFSVRQEMNP